MAAEVWGVPYLGPVYGWVEHGEGLLLIRGDDEGVFEVAVFPEPVNPV